MRLDAYARARGGAGARNHLLVLPAVVCATQVAATLGRRDGAVTITHQHGCLHVGDDLSHTAATLEGVAVNPNVGGVLVVSLGCETLQGRRLAERIAARGQRVELVGLQSSGGSARAIEQGNEALDRLGEELAADVRSPVGLDRLVLGLDGRGPIADAIEREAELRGVPLVRPAAGTGVGAHTHPDLAAMGAGAIIAVLEPGAAPVGFAIGPVLTIATDHETFTALTDDLDLDGSSDPPKTVAALAVTRAICALAGKPTATERTGAHDFVLRRLAMTM